MALRAQANKHARSMFNYIGYSEYRITPGASELKIIERTPHARIHIPRCPWHAAWKENGLLAFGRLYCSEIDQALVRGFNPELQVDVIATLTDGAAQCEFVYHNVDITIPHYLLIQYRRAISPGAKAVQPWDCHVGHLFRTFEKVAGEELGQVGQEVIQAGLTEFAERYGEQAMQRVVASRSKDYEGVSEG
jgi:L-2-amino-thiazoline-4-carboxylic acid hydrolase